MCVGAAQLKIVQPPSRAAPQPADRAAAAAGGRGRGRGSGSGRGGRPSDTGPAAGGGGAAGAGGRGGDGGGAGFRMRLSQLAVSLARTLWAQDHSLAAVAPASKGLALTNARLLQGNSAKLLVNPAFPVAIKSDEV